MKRERNTRKELLDLYLYFDMSEGNISKKKISQRMNDRYQIIKDKYDKKYSNRRWHANEWYEYYGIFKAKDGRIAVDPIRFHKKTHQLTKRQLAIMGKRHTTFFHPNKVSRNDFFVNGFTDEIDGIIKSFKETHKPIIDKSVENIKAMEKLYPGDYYNLQCGISSPMAAETWARMKNWENQQELAYEKFELYTSLYAQFFHQMSSRIEAKSVELYSLINPKMKKWTRDKLYDNVNINKKSSRDLPSFKYHDRLYLIWNFIKHNSLDTYEKLKKGYPDVLIDAEYQAGDLAIHYLKLNEKLILELLEGTKQFFIEWCELNLNETYYEAQWNFDEYFIDTAADEIEMIRNPLGLGWWDDID